jgi:hypothetical protein
MHCNCVRQDVNRRRRRRRGRCSSRRDVLDGHGASGGRKPHGYAGLRGVGYRHMRAQALRRRRRIRRQPGGDRTYVRTGEGRSRRNGCTSVILRRLRLVILRRFRAGRRGCRLSRSGLGCDCGVRGGRRGCPGVSRGVGCCGCGRNRVGRVCSRRGREGPVRGERGRDHSGTADKAETADARFAISDRDSIRYMRHFFDKG